MSLISLERLGPSLSALRLPRTRRRVDVLLLGSALLLSLIGALLVWAATKPRLDGPGDNPQSFLYRHLLNVGIGIVLVIVVSRFDVRLFRLIGPVIYVVSLIGLALVFPFGTTVNGAHAWIEFGSEFALQPSEFMKLGLIIGMAVMFAERAGQREPGAPAATSDLAVALALLAVPIALIMLEPDLGSAMVLTAAMLGVLIAAGVRTRWIVLLLILGVLGVILAIKAGMLAHYQLARFRAFVNPNADIQGSAYNVHQARIAVANGGVFGKGLFHGPQTNGAYVPEQETDFIFSVAGEELGFAGAAVIIALFGVLCWRGLRIAADAEPAGRLVAVGIVCWFAFQAFQSIGMNIGLTPVTGLPLPFVSYGGSSMFAQALAVGVLQAIWARGRPQFTA